MKLPLFLSIFLILYGGMHLFAFIRARAAFRFGPLAGLLTISFMVVLVLAPIVVRLLERWGLERMAEVLALIGYTWMGIMFLFVCASILVDVYRLLTYLAALITGAHLSWIRPAPHTAFLASCFIALSVATYGYFEALSIRTDRITIHSPKIPKEAGRIRIVQISDVHLGLMVRGDRLKRILKEVEAADPDILVSTGDLVDGQIDNLLEEAEMIKAVRTRYGKYAVTGNHEFYAGISRSLDLTRESGFFVLRGQGVKLPNGINVLGVDDPAGQAYGLLEGEPERDLLSAFSRDRFTLLLKHRPTLNHNDSELFDLQLSGHVHKGQIFPFRFVTEMVYPYGTGLVALPGPSLLRVSRGSGTWGPPIRFLAPPEVTVIDLEHGERFAYFLSSPEVIPLLTGRPL